MKTTTFQRVTRAPLIAAAELLAKELPCSVPQAGSVIFRLWLEGGGGQFIPRENLEGLESRCGWLHHAPAGSLLGTLFRLELLVSEDDGLRVALVPVLQ